VIPSLPVAEASLLVEIASLLSRATLFSAGRQKEQQGAKTPGRTGQLSAGRVIMRQESSKLS